MLLPSAAIHDYQVRLDPSSAYPCVTRALSFQVSLKTFKSLKAKLQRRPIATVSKSSVKLVRNKSNFYTYLKNDKVLSKAGQKDGKRMEGEEGGG